MKKGRVAKVIAAGTLSAAMFFTASKADPAAIVNAEAAADYVKPRTEQVDTISSIDSDIMDEEDFRAREKRARSRQRMADLKDSAIGSAVLALSVLAKAGMKMLGAVLARLLGASITGVLGFLGDVILNFLIIAGLFSLAFRILFPGRSLRELWTARNILIMALASVGLEIVRYVMAMLSSRAYLISELCQCLMTIGIIGFAYYKVFRLEGRAAQILKNILKSKAGIFTVAGFSFGSLFAVLVKTFLQGIRRTAAFAQLVFVFIVCALVVFCGIRLFRPKKNILLLKGQTEV